MLQTPPDPAVKAALARCFAAHHALKSLVADVRITAHGVPKVRSGRIALALERPGRLRLEAQGALRREGIFLTVASQGFVYQADATDKTYTIKSVPVDGDALAYGLEESDILPLPVFLYLMAGKEGADSLLSAFSSVRLEREVVLGGATLLAFHFAHQGTRQTVRFGEKDGLLRQVVLTQGRVTIQEDYQGLRVNQSLPLSLWEFVPPTGFQDENQVLRPKPTSTPVRSLGSGSVTTASGLQYEDVRTGTGPTVEKDMTVTVHYTGSFLDGKQFDTSRGREPFQVKIPGPVIKGWNEGLLGMKVGGIRRMIIPPSLGYGEKGAGDVIPPNATLFFEIELLDVEKNLG